MLVDLPICSSYYWQKMIWPECVCLFISEYPHCPVAFIASDAKMGFLSNYSRVGLDCPAYNAQIHHTHCSPTIDAKHFKVPQSQREGFKKVPYREIGCYLETLTLISLRKASLKEWTSFRRKCFFLWIWEIKIETHFHTLSPLAYHFITPILRSLNLYQTARIITKSNQ